MTDVTRSDVRGQCDLGHVLVAEIYGPELPDSWMCSCPLPNCGHPIVWERRPGWMDPKQEDRPVLELADLFDMVELPVPRLATSERHLVADYCDDDGWTTVPDSADILTCKRCGALVPDSHASVHLNWHREIEDPTGRLALDHRNAP